MGSHAKILIFVTDVLIHTSIWGHFLGNCAKCELCQRFPTVLRRFFEQRWGAT